MNIIEDIRRKVKRQTEIQEKKITLHFTVRLKEVQYILA